jgi:hypothetical protein
MNSHSSLDREAFQKLLANAFAVQDSGLDSQSLFAFVEIQRMIAVRQPDVDMAMQQIADRARTIAYASGVAVALLTRDQLVYRAGSGSAARNRGHHLTAVLSVSGHHNPRKEILRVENAQTDLRIEGAICRQFGAMALLILPIYRERALAGVLEVLFDEPHVFQYAEVRAYQLMAGLIGEALSSDVPVEKKEASAAQPALVPHASRNIPAQAPIFQSLSEPEPSRRIARIYEGACRFVSNIPDLRRRAKAAIQILPTPKRLLFDKFRWNLVAVPVLLVLAISSWIAYHRQMPPSPESTQGASNVPRPVPAVLSKQSASDQQRSTAHETRASSASSPFKRIRIGKNEIDYVAEDVTIRHFIDNPEPPRVRRSHRQIDIGEDVTVHYFAVTPGSAARLEPASAIQTSAEPSLPNSK